MKKLLAIMLSVLMTCSVMTACGDKKDDKDEKKNDTSVSDKADKNEEAADLDIEVALTDDPAAPLGETVGDKIKADETVFDTLKSLADAKEFTFDVEVSVVSEMMTMDMPMAMSTDGTNVYCNVDLFGMSVEVLVLDGKTYILDQTNKVYCVDESGEQSSIADSMDMSSFASVDNIKGACKATINGVEFDRYEIESSGTAGFAYVYGGELKYLASVTEAGEKSLTTFNKLSTKADADLLKLPEGYKEITSDEFGQLVYGDLLGE